MEKMKNKITIKTIPMKDYREFYVTLDKLDLAGDFFEETLAKLEKEDILLSKVVFFGNVAPMEKIITRIRSKVPCLVIGNSLPDENVSVCISGIKIMQGESQFVELDGEIIGRYFKLPDYEYLNVSGSYLKNRQADFRAEADGEYAKIAKVLARYDFSAKDIYRFWNYMVRVWENYPAFNEARNSYFKKNEITKLPAATGIEAVLGGGKKSTWGLKLLR